MAYFDVTYDLVGRKESEYQDLWDEMDRLGAAKYQYSAYFVELSSSASEVRDHFKSYIHEKDRFRAGAAVMEAERTEAGFI